MGIALSLLRTTDRANNSIGRGRKRSRRPRWRNGYKTKPGGSPKGDGRKKEGESAKILTPSFGGSGEKRSSLTAGPRKCSKSPEECFDYLAEKEPSAALSGHDKKTGREGKRKKKIRKTTSTGHLFNKREVRDPSSSLISREAEERTGQSAKVDGRGENYFTRPSRGDSSTGRTKEAVRR